MLEYRKDPQGKHIPYFNLWGQSIKTQVTVVSKRSVIGSKSPYYEYVFIPQSTLFPEEQSKALCSLMYLELFISRFPSYKPENINPMFGFS